MTDLFDKYEPMQVTEDAEDLILLVTIDTAWDENSEGLIEEVVDTDEGGDDYEDNN